jgi:hypothetical protein
MSLGFYTGIVDKSVGKPRVTEVFGFYQWLSNRLSSLVSKLIFYFFGVAKNDSCYDNQTRE